jgi:hypothetical protein
MQQVCFLSSSLYDYLCGDYSCFFLFVIICAVITVMFLSLCDYVCGDYINFSFSLCEYFCGDYSDVSFSL